ncbi:MAG: restriction endonuclease subunit S [Alistipes sp.]|nr:restriction endonuclease subunit S [Alistipes sp.]
MTSWKTYKLGDILNFRRGHDLPKTEMVNGEIPVAGSNGVIGYHNVSTPIEPCITIGRSGNVGTPYIYDKCWAHNTVLYVDDFKGNDPLYLYYLLKTIPLASYGGGSAVPTLNRNHIHPIEIKHTPSLEEQRRIAGILGAIDDKIENNRRINTNLELQAQALYKQWFVDNRSDDWETLMLDDVATLSAGGDKPQICSEQKTPECNIPIYSNGIDNEGLYGYTNNPRITENSITISARGTIGFVCLRTEPYVPIVRLISVVPAYENMSAYFLYLWALTQNISGTGTTQQQLTVPAFRTTKIVVPSQKALIKFNQVVKTIFDNIKQNKKENETLATLRDTLLPKLMNGEIKL